MTDTVDTWARIRQRNLEKIVAKLLEQEKVPKKFIKDWMDKAADPKMVEQSIEFDPEGGRLAGRGIRGLRATTYLGVRNNTPRASRSGAFACRTG